METKLDFIYNKPVWKAWLGYRAALFLELGGKNPPKFATDYEKGDYTIGLDRCDWTIYRSGEVIADSGSENFEKMAKDVKVLEGLSIQEIKYLGDQKEWLIQFSDGTQLNIEFFPTGSGFTISKGEETFILNSTGEIQLEAQER